MNKIKIIQTLEQLLTLRCYVTRFAVKNQMFIVKSWIFIR